MTVSSYINSIPAFTEISQVPIEALTIRSPFIQSWKANLQLIFRDEGGVWLFSQKIFAKESLRYPRLRIGGRTVPVERIIVWADIRQHHPSDIMLPIQFQDFLRERIDDLLKMIQDSGTNRPFIFSQFFVFRPDSQEERVVMYKHHFIQLLASLLNLYKDMLVGRGSILEERKLQNLTKVLEKLPEETCKEKAYKVLNQVILGVKKQIDADGVASKRSIFSLREDPIIKIFTSSIRGADNNTLIREVHNLSLDSFSALVRCIPAWLPNIRLQLPLNEEVFLLVLMQKAPFLFLENISLNLLQKLLNAMLRNDIIYLLSTIPVVKIIDILKDLPIDVMKNILLEIPKKIVYSLKEALLKSFLSRKMDESLTQLKVAYYKSLIPLNMFRKEVPSLRSLSIKKICQASNRCLVARGGSSLSLTYLNRMEVLYPDFQKEVRDQVRIMTNNPRVGEAVQFSVEESGFNYVPELDLLSLASMVSGYEDCIKNILLEKCGNN